MNKEKERAVDDYKKSTENLLEARRKAELATRELIMKDEQLKETIRQTRQAVLASRARLFQNGLRISKLMEARCEASVLGS